MHITLAFIGAWPIVRLPLLLDAVGEIRGDTLHVVLDTLGAFRRAGIAWIGSSSPPAALMQLQVSLAAALASGGVPFDDAQPFRAHVRLARRCRGPYPRGVVDAIACDVGRFSLMQSDTRAEGARYRTPAGWPLDRDMADLRVAATARSRVSFKPVRARRVASDRRTTRSTTQGKDA